MKFSRALLLGALAATVTAYGDFLTNPELNTVGQWKRAAAERRTARRAAIARAAEANALRDRADADVVASQTSASMTRGSQPNPTQPCFNVYDIPPPVNNASGLGPNQQPGFGYQQPQNNDVRSPCPALNTLANHGYLPRDGRGIDGETLVQAFNDAWGIDQSVINVAKTNALGVCTFQSAGGEQNEIPPGCAAFDLNVLNEPHQFEHDHSLSRNDYEQSTLPGPTNNHVFNGTVFNESLAVLGGSCYMTIEQANEVRLQRETDQFLLDKPGWFTLAPGVQETEIGFIFSVMSENNQPGGSGEAAGASVRVNWWQYWFMYESFPTPLGWQVPSPAGTAGPLVLDSFVTSISSLVQSATITSTPVPYYTQFRFGPSGSTVETNAAGVTFQPTLINLYTAIGQFNKRDVEATPTPEPSVQRF